MCKWYSLRYMMHKPRSRENLDGTTLLLISRVQECGDRMHWEIKGISSERARSLAAYLDRATSTSASSSSSGHRERSDSPTSTSSETSNRLSSAATTAPTSISDAEEGDLSIAVTDGNEDLPSLTPVKPRFLELCVDSGRYSKTVGEVNLTYIKSDGELFQLIVNVYKHERANRGLIRPHLPQRLRNFLGKVNLEWSFTEPSKIIFRKVRPLHIHFRA